MFLSCYLQLDILRIKCPDDFRVQKNLSALVIKSSANIHKLYTSDIHKKCEQEKGYQKTFNTISQ